MRASIRTDACKIYLRMNSRVSYPLRVLVASLVLLNITCAQQFRQSFYSFAPPSCDPGSTVGIVSSTGLAYYDIDPGTAPFTIRGDSGNIVATNSGQGTYTVTVRLMDQFLQRTSTTAIVQIQCPTSSTRAAFPQPSYQFGPVCQARVPVGIVSLTNPPAGTRYFMAPPLTGILNIDRNTGIISTVQRLPTSSVSFKVLAFFPGGSASAPVTILACSKPTIPPGMQLTISSCAAGTVVGQVPVTSPSSSMRFAVLSGGANNFIIDQSTGRLTLTNNLITAPGQRLSFVLLVEVTDTTSGSSSRGRVMVQGVCSGITNIPTPSPSLPPQPQPPPTISDFR